MLKKLKSKYGDLYRQDNVILSGTHTHSGPAGYFQYTLFWITSKGLIRPSLNAIVNGIVKVGVAQRVDRRAHKHSKGGGDTAGANGALAVMFAVAPANAAVPKHPWRWVYAYQQNQTAKQKA